MDIPIATIVDLLKIQQQLLCIQHDINCLVIGLVNPIVGTVVVVQKDPSSPHSGDETMQKCTVKLVKASHMQAPAPGGKFNAAQPGFTLADNGNGNFTNFGQDAAGAQVDITSQATITVTSADPTICTVTSPVGMNFSVAGVKPGVTTVTVVTTFNTPGTGPFSVDVPFTITVGPVVGTFVAQAGTPVPTPAPTP